MGQYMNRQVGMQALRDAGKALATAQDVLHEEEGGRMNLIGPMAQIIGGIQDAIAGLVDLLDESATDLGEDLLNAAE